ncbi:MAG: DUF5665 domain-containing protein [Halanaerobiaceae bacterium]
MEKFEEKVMEKLEEISRRTQENTIAEYVEMIRSPRRMIFINFVSGLARGLGIAVGATILGAIILIVLFRLGRMNIPVIGRFIARIVKIVQTYL